MTKSPVRGAFCYVFGIISRCRHDLPGGLAASWMAHLCGLCDAQAPSENVTRRTAGPCPLRGMRAKATQATTDQTPALARSPTCEARKMQPNEGTLQAP
ncbi:hypothetical protein [Streptomyces marincola]|uniref:hypothetical protein n=1 Tax=Streptomyces marincola TaxID=2878388 RepID=UPI000D1A5245|nr:hypothetical protein [Streptomyces marincola]